ncbi:hypothetical protein BC936DRAFT_143660 [Jimgerdemannia flammicorona]|uniref:Alcohol dehydrogenase-like C-terminal domain-containing protein n=1 Tax=Jimgerdemannia flammicorona TaxID=994334 RepID=A0A433DDL3_9FUNG|nr:hypothetical protein BC936DRAFT_143660 [Jimgerdemannia flammicorona]
MACRLVTVSRAVSPLAVDSVGTAGRGSRVGARRDSCMDGERMWASCFPPSLPHSTQTVTDHLSRRISNGQGLHGAQAQFVRVPLAEATLLKIPVVVTDDEALLLGDIFSTGYFCAENGLTALRDQTPQEAVVVVVGCGPVGIMAVVAARDLGCTNVYAVDSVKERLELAERFGATPVHLHEGDPVGTVKKATDGRGADVVLEVVGAHDALSLAYELLRPAGILSSVGVHTAPEFPFTPSQGYDKNLTYRSGRCPSRAMMERLLPVLEARKYDIAAIVSHHVGLDQAVEMYRRFEGKVDGCTKVVFRPWE